MEVFKTEEYIRKLANH